tara:strand:+ start:598 stop:1254 length:657 start_codon:yes stop_codon:yes gene_type:complete
MYRVILLKNGKYSMTMHRCKTRDTSFINYRKIIDTNVGIMFPRKYVNYKGIKKITYKVAIIKDTEEGDEFRVLRDKMGRTYTEKPLGSWTVLDDNPYEFEETFWMFGRNPVHDRVTIHDIIKPMMIGAYQKKMTKQLIVVHNKLVLHNENQFEMIICKCKKDAQRLHHALNDACKKNKIKSIIFMGTASPATISYMYDIIHENTSWAYTKIRRTSTRP